MRTHPPPPFLFFLFWQILQDNGKPSVCLEVYCIFDIRIIFSHGKFEHLTESDNRPYRISDVICALKPFRCF